MRKILLALTFLTSLTFAGDIRLKLGYDYLNNSTAKVVDKDSNKTTYGILAPTHIGKIEFGYNYNYIFANRVSFGVEGGASIGAGYTGFNNESSEKETYVVINPGIYLQATSGYFFENEIELKGLIKTGINSDIYIGLSNSSNSGYVYDIPIIGGVALEYGKLVLELNAGVRYVPYKLQYALQGIFNAVGNSNVNGYGSTENKLAYNKEIENGDTTYTDKVIFTTGISIGFKLF